MDMITDAFNDKTIDEFYVEHPFGADCFTLK